MGFSPAPLPLPSSEPAPGNFLALTDKTMDEGVNTQSASEHASKENILLFQRAAHASSSKSLGDQATNYLSSCHTKQLIIDTIPVPCVSVEKQIISPKEDQE
eukprot:c37249_g1_i1 orf=85-390(+)